MQVPIDHDLGQLSVMLGGRVIPDPYDRLRRVCGLSWSGGSGETHSYWYYDILPAGDPDRIEPVDVLAAASILPGLCRSDLAFFHDRADLLDGWLAMAPTDVRLVDAVISSETNGGDAGDRADSVLDHLVALADWDIPVSLALLTTVLHRKRPALVPITDQLVTDHYRRYTGEGDVRAAWPTVIRGIASDLRFGANQLTLSMIGVRLGGELAVVPDVLRRVDLLMRTAPVDELDSPG